MKREILGRVTDTYGFSVKDGKVIREDTTTFVDGRCQRCGWTSHSQDVHGEACDRCGRRLTWPAKDNTEDRALRGEYDG